MHIANHHTGGSYTFWFCSKKLYLLHPCMQCGNMDFNSTNNASYTYSNPSDEMSVPLFATYALMLIISMMLIVTVVPAVFIIHIILTSKELHKKHYYFVVNLMVSDILGAISRFNAKMFIMVLYLLNLNVTAYHILRWINLFLVWMVILTHLTSSVSFIPLAVERFITIIFPYRYRNILTNKRAFMMGAGVWVGSAILGIMGIAIVQFEIVVAFGEHVPVKNIKVLILIGFIVQVFSLLLITSTNISLHHQITTSNKMLKDNQQLDSEDDSQTKTIQGRLQIFRSHVKLMMSLQLLGGVDSLIRLIYPTMMTLLLLTTLDRATFLLIQQLLLQPLQWSVPLYFTHLYLPFIIKLYIRKLLGNSGNVNQHFVIIVK